MVGISGESRYNLIRSTVPAALAPDVEIAIPPRSPVVYPPRKRWTRAECQSLESTGLWNRDRFELIDGELITKMPKNRPQALVVMLVAEWLRSVFGPYRLNREVPVDVAPEDNPTSEPEPDIAVLVKSAKKYQDAPPPAADVQLLVEVSDSTVAFDLGPKARLYARAGIPDYWVFDIQSRRIITHRDPRDGVYTTVAAYIEGETVAPLIAPEALLPVVAAFAINED